MSTPTSRRKAKPKGGSLLTSTLDTGAPNPLFADAARRHELIEHAAYFRAEQRGFEPGHEIEDWFNAEQEIDARLFRGETPSL